MTIDLAKLPPLEAPAGTTIDEVDADPEALRDAAMIALTSNGMPPWSVGRYLEALERVPERETIRTFLARRDGAPLAASTLVSRCCRGSLQRRHPPGRTPHRAGRARLDRCHDRR